MSRGLAVGLGAVLLVLGVLSFAVGGIPYTKREQVLDVGPIQASVETEERVGIPVVLGGLLALGGVGLLVYGVRKG